MSPGARRLKLCAFGTKFKEWRCASHKAFKVLQRGLFTRMLVFVKEKRGLPDKNGVYRAERGMWICWWLILMLALKRRDSPDETHSRYVCGWRKCSFFIGRSSSFGNRFDSLYNFGLMWCYSFWEKSMVYYSRQTMFFDGALVALLIIICICISSTNVMDL